MLESVTELVRVIGTYVVAIATAGISAYVAVQSKKAETKALKEVEKLRAEYQAEHARLVNHLSTSSSTLSEQVAALVRLQREVSFIQEGRSSPDQMYPDLLFLKSCAGSNAELDKTVTNAIDGIRFNEYRNWENCVVLIAEAISKGYVYPPASPDADLQ